MTKCHFSTSLSAIQDTTINFKTNVLKIFIGDLQGRSMYSRLRSHACIYRKHTFFIKSLGPMYIPKQNI